MTLSPRRLALFLTGMIILGALVCAGFYSWRSHVMKSQERRCHASAQKLLARSRPLEALSIIRMMKGTSGEDYLEKWMPLEIQALEQSRNTHRLLYLYGQYPLEILKQEKASLLVARALLGLGNLGMFTQVRNAWKAKEQAPELWFALDVDALLREGKSAEALEKLSSRSFPDAADTGRLIRLAMLKSGGDMEEAWGLLERAFRADPRNADVRSFRAQILESWGAIPSARLEYVAALLCDPENPVLRDQLAEFYRRQGNYTLALQTWKEGLTGESPDYLWIKTLFWAKVAARTEIPLYGAASPPGEMAPLVRILQNLKEQAFWDDKAVQEELSIQKLASVRQEIFWLRLIQALHDGSEARAMEMLKNNPFRGSSFDPDLERCLKVILVYRRWGILAQTEAAPVQPVMPRRLKHQFFEQLEAMSGKSKGPVPPELEALLRSREVFSAAFLAAGWLEASLELNSRQSVPRGLPDWLAYGYTQALRYSRGNGAAFEYAQKQNPTPQLELIKAEIMLADSRFDKAIPKLTSLSRNGTDVGFRASWLLSLASLDRGDLSGAERTVEASPPLLKSTAGREILARIAYDKGDVEKADKLYGLLAEESLEAKAYLVRRAFQAKDLGRARKFTEELIRHFPDMLELRENMKQIAEAEHGS